MKQQKMIIYHSYVCQIGGVETFLYNFCLNLRDYYDITVLYGSGDYLQLKRLSRLVNMEKFDPNKIYKADIFIRNSVWGAIPKVDAKRSIEMRHANYDFLKKNGVLDTQYTDMGIKEIVGCGEYVSKMSHKVLKDNPTTIINILAPKEKTSKILRLISCTRIDAEKGWNRMLKMMQMMRDEGIKFEWNIFTNNPQECDFEEAHFYKQRFDIWDYLADADYTVLLSDSEGMPYTVQESLQYQTPCIVTDIGGCTEIIKDGKNGYVVPLDMNFNIKKILNIPKCGEYNNGALEKWLKYIGGGVYKKKPLNEPLNEPTIKLKVKKTMEYSGILVDFKPKGHTLPGWIIEGDEIEVFEKEGLKLIKEKIAEKV